MYQILEGGVALREADMTYIPPNPENADYAGYLVFMEAKEKEEEIEQR